MKKRTGKLHLVEPSGIARIETLRMKHEKWVTSGKHEMPLIEFHLSRCRTLHFLEPNSGQLNEC